LLICYSYFGKVLVAILVSCNFDFSIHSGYMVKYVLWYVSLSDTTVYRYG
jgi:hypothetical protein